jgi:hypothetical protein
LTFIPKTHPAEEVFETYAFGRLSDQETIGFEEHLLICEDCQAKLAETDESIQLIKAATAAYASKHYRSAAPLFRFSGSLGWNVTMAAVLVLTCLTTLFSWRTTTGEPRTVVLDAYRGGASEAPAGETLDLRIDLSEVRPAAAYRVEIVDKSGRRVWFGGTPARVNGGFPPGIYWVRLSTDTDELLREFGLRTVESK